MHEKCWRDTSCESNIDERIQQGQVVCVKFIDLILLIPRAELFVESIHGLSRVEALLIECIVESRDGNHTACYDKLFGEVFLEVLRVERVLVDHRHFGVLHGFDVVSR